MKVIKEVLVVSVGVSADEIPVKRKLERLKYLPSYLV